MRTILAVICLVVATSVNAAECLRSADSVRENSPGAWPSWTLRMKGHEGTKCWFPSDSRRIHVAAKTARRPSRDNHTPREVAVAAPAKVVAEPAFNRNFDLVWNSIISDIKRSRDTKFVELLDGYGFEEAPVSISMWLPWRAR